MSTDSSVAVNTGRTEKDPAKSETQTLPDPIFTPEEIATATKMIDKVIQHALIDAIASVVQPAIRKGLLGALGEIAGTGKKPGGGQGGGQGTANETPEPNG